jgi:branched-subunit amino acid ABC-type transport system permease component
VLHLFVEQTINGIVTGNIYGLIALGLALVFGVAGIVNFAH